eukprot:9908917-Ditylum_brightwellii.AAC.1
MKQNNRVHCNRDDGVDNSCDHSDDGGDKHLRHLSEGVDCCLWLEMSKILLLIVIKTMVLTILVTIVMMVVTSTLHISHERLIAV